MWVWTLIFTPSTQQPCAEHMPEPILQEITNYVRQRGTIHLYSTTADVRAEVRAVFSHRRSSHTARIIRLTLVPGIHPNVQ